MGRRGCVRYLGERQNRMDGLVIGHCDFGARGEVSDLGGRIGYRWRCRREGRLWREEMGRVSVRSKEDPIGISWYPFSADVVRKV